MQVRKEYKSGGFFSNSQDRFSHMAGSKGGFDRKEFRDLRRRKRRGESLSGPEGQRLQFMQNVRKDRFKKGLGAAALGGAAALAAPALLSNVGALGGKGLAGMAGKGTAGAGKFAKLKSFLGKFRKGKEIVDQAKELKETLTPEQMQEIDDGNFGQPDQFMEQGGRIMMGGGMMQFNPAEREMLMAMLGAKLPR